MVQKNGANGVCPCGPESAEQAQCMVPYVNISDIERGEILSSTGCDLPPVISGDVLDTIERMPSPSGVYVEYQSRIS